MILLNFAHPLTADQLDQLATLLGHPVDRVLDRPAAFDDQQPYAPQIAALLDSIELTPAQWQGEPLLVVLPSLNYIAAGLLAALHGRMGYWPTVVRLRPVEESTPRRFEVAEVLDLAKLRDEARLTRASSD